MGMSPEMLDHTKSARSASLPQCLSLPLGYHGVIVREITTKDEERTVTTYDVNLDFSVFGGIEGFTLLFGEDLICVSELVRFAANNPTAGKAIANYLSYAGQRVA